MKQCSEKAYAACNRPLRCNSRVKAFFLPGSPCDEFNRSLERKTTNGDRLRAMSDKELAEFLCGKIDCYPETCPGFELCNSHAVSANGIMKWLRMPVKDVYSRSDLDDKTESGLLEED